MGHVFSLAVAAASALILTGCASSGTGPSGGPPAFPHTRTVDVVDDYHGTRVAAPYRWLDDLDAPEVQRWVEAQNAFADRWLGDDPLRPRILRRLLELRAPWDPFNAPFWSPAGDYGLSLQLAPGGDHRRLLVRRGHDGEPRVLVDPKTFGADVDVVRFRASPDGRHVAYELSERGDEWVTTRIRRMEGGDDLPEVIHGIRGDPVLWTRDGRGFFYVHLERPGPDEGVPYRDFSVRHHVLGTPQESDRIIMRAPEGNAEIVLRAALIAGGRYLLVSEGTGASWAGMAWVLSRVHLLDLADPRAPDLSGTPRPLIGEMDAGYGFVASEGPVLYFITDRDAPRKRLIAVDLRDPTPGRWRDVIPESVHVLQSVRRIGGHFVATYLEDVQSQVRVFDLEGRPVREIRLPPLSSVEVEPLVPDSVDLVTYSFLRSPVVTVYDLLTGGAEIALAPPPVFDAAAYEERQVWYGSKDGTRIPMFLVHRRGITLDGSHPTLLYGYGSSGDVMAPRYDPGVLAWLELGGVYAMPNLRGGGEFGRSWYEAAVQERKQTTFDDFIAAAEWLIAQGYTSPSRLAIRGRSAGGLLVGAVTTQRPELFAVAVGEVPGVDVLALGRGRHFARSGSAREPAHFPFLYAYAPIERVVPGTCYPATLLLTAMNDDRPQGSFKFAAALQAAQACARPVLLRVHPGGAHGRNRTPNEGRAEEAEILAFVARQLGLHP